MLLAAFWKIDASVVQLRVVVLCVGTGGDLLKHYARIDAMRPPQIMKIMLGGPPNPSTIMLNETWGASGDLLEASCFQESDLFHVFYATWSILRDILVGAHWILKGSPK